LQSAKESAVSYEMDVDARDLAFPHQGFTLSRQKHQDNHFDWPRQVTIKPDV
jgi:hypothetical protein